MEKVLITGATGYIGSNLLHRLIGSDCTVGILKRENSDIKRIQNQLSKIEVFEYDGTLDSLIRTMESFKPEVIFHLASSVIPRHSAKDIEDLVNSNILFGIHILEAMQISGVDRIINTSTSWQTPYNDTYDPYSLYTALKQSFEDILKFYSNIYNVKSISLRLPDTYGPNDDRPKILNLIKNSSKNCRQLKMSAGEQELDLLYIEDIMDGFIQAYNLLKNTNNKFNVFALSSKQPIKLKKLVSLFESVNNVQIDIQWGALKYRDNEIMEVYIPNNILPDWESKISLKEGLKMFL